ncbi:MAG: MBL fold metallo-hydrolase, partial [Anaerolineae bacterium]
MNQQSTPPHRIELPTGLPVPSVNVYLFTEPEPALVDTGTKYPPALQALQAGLAQHGLAIADLARVIISHPHVDHFGLAGYIAAHSPARIHVLQDSVPWLVNYPPMWRERVEFFGNHLFKKLGLPDEIVTPILAHYAKTESMCESVPAERIEPFDAGDHLSLGGLPWQVLHTPGHTNTLTCFFQPGSRQFLSTDMLLPLTPTPIPDPPPPGHTRR